jgi:hypothetical protein
MASKNKTIKFNLKYLIYRYIIKKIQLNDLFQNMFSEIKCKNETDYIRYK